VHRVKVSSCKLMDRRPECSVSALFDLALISWAAIACIQKKGINPLRGRRGPL